MNFLFTVWKDSPSIIMMVRLLNYSSSNPRCFCFKIIEKEEKWICRLEFKFLSFRPFCLIKSGNIFLFFYIKKILMKNNKTKCKRKGNTNCLWSNKMLHRTFKLILAIRSTRSRLDVMLWLLQDQYYLFQSFLEQHAFSKYFVNVWFVICKWVCVRTSLEKGKIAFT